MKRIASSFLLFICVLCAICGRISSAADARPNVLFIAVDDLNDWIGCLGGHSQVQTPNIDKLAARGTLFTNAHCQAPLCNPSRSSLLTGLRPSSTGICGLSPGIRLVERTEKHVTLPQTFTSAGYYTYTCGKIYHDGSIQPRFQKAEFNEWGPAPPIGRRETPFVDTPQHHKAMDWGPFPERDEDGGDYQIATAAIGAIEKAPQDKPFFIGCGFRLPHVPCYAPQKYFDLYPAETTKLPEVRDDDRDDTPRFSWYLHWKLPEPRLKFLKEANQWLPLVRAYLASISFMDAQVGRVLDALEKSGRAEQTIVVLWSDHGWHLGEKLITGKNTLWQRSTHVPLIFAGPGITQGQKCGRPAELLDIFPTLLELGGFATRDDLEGHSLVPQLRDANAPRPWPAITTHNTGNHSVRTEQWRYIHYADGSEELYDVVADPNEWTNVAADPKHAAVKKELAAWLPKIDLPPAPNSKARVLTYDAQTGAVTWEGAPVKPTDKIPEIEDGAAAAPREGANATPFRLVAMRAPPPPGEFPMPPLEKSFRWTAELYSGSAPKDAEGYQALAEQGIRTVIRVDAASPDAKLAKAAGLEVVHAPVGFSHLEADLPTILQVVGAKPSPYYVCCMYGTPRSPAVASMIWSYMNHGSQADAKAHAEKAGVIATYAGILANLDKFDPAMSIPKRPESLPFPEQAGVPAMRLGMVRIVNAWDPLRKWKADGLKLAATTDAAAMQHRAATVARICRELADVPTAAVQGDDFVALMRDCAAAADVVAKTLDNSTPLDDARRAELLKQLDAVGNACGACHRDYRN